MSCCACPPCRQHEILARRHRQLCPRPCITGGAAPCSPCWRLVILGRAHANTSCFLPSVGGLFCLRRLTSHFLSVPVRPGVPCRPRQPLWRWAPLRHQGEPGGSDTLILTRSKRNQMGNYVGDFCGTDNCEKPKSFALCYRNRRGHMISSLQVKIQPCDWTRTQSHLE